MVADGHLPAAVRKTEEAQSLIQTAPRPLERAAVMRDLSVSLFFTTYRNTRG